MDEYFDELELNDYSEQFVRIISKNSPERDIDAYPHAIKWHGVIVSPYPGNLKNNGNIRRRTDADSIVVKHGYDPAPYALYANKTSRKPQYIEKSVKEFFAKMEAIGWEGE